MVRQSRPADDEVSNHHDFLDERSMDEQPLRFS